MNNLKSKSEKCKIQERLCVVRSILLSADDNLILSYNIDSHPSQPKRFEQTVSRDYIWQGFENGSYDGLCLVSTYNNDILLLDNDSPESVEFTKKLFKKHNIEIKTSVRATPGHLTIFCKVSEKIRRLFQKYNISVIKIGELEIKKQHTANLPGGVKRTKDNKEYPYQFIDGDERLETSFLSDEMVLELLSYSSYEVSVENNEYIIKNKKSKSSDNVDDNLEPKNIFEFHQDNFRDLSADTYKKLFTEICGLEYVPFKTSSSLITVYNPLKESETNKNNSFHIHIDSGRFSCHKTQTYGEIHELPIYINEFSKIPKSSPLSSYEEIRDKVKKEIVSGKHIKVQIEIIKKIHNILGNEIPENFLNKKYQIKKSLTNSVKANNFNDVNKYSTEFIEKNKDNGKRSIIALKAPMGTGKTQHFLSPIVKEYGKESRLTINPTIALNRQASKIFQTKVYSEVNKNELSNNLSTTLDSLYKFTDNIYGCLILDEIKQLENHLVFGQTSIQKNRLEVQNSFSKVISNANVVLCADANLDDTTVEFIIRCNSDDIYELLIIELDIKQNKGFHYPVSNYKEFRQQCALGIERTNENNGFHYVSDSVKNTEAMELMCLEDAKKKGYKPEQVLVINSTNSNKENVKEALTDINGYMKRFNVHYLIITPSAGQGISNELQRFKTVYTEATGQINLDSLMQLSSRSRNVDTVYSYTHKQEKKPVFEPKEKIKNMHCAIDNTTKCKDVYDTARALHFQNKFADELFSITLEDMMNNPLCQYYAQRNYEDTLFNNNIREQVTQGFEDLGFVTKDLKESNSNGEAQKKFEQFEHQHFIEETKLVCEGLPYDPVYDDYIISQLSDTYENKKLKEGMYLQNTFYSKKFTFEEIYYLNRNKSLINKIKNLHLCLNYNSYVKDSVNKINKVINNSKEHLEFLPYDINFVTELFNFIDTIGIKGNLNKLSEWNKNDSEIFKEIYSKCSENVNALASAMNLKLDSNPTRMVNNILRKLGFTILTKKVKNVRYSKIAQLKDCEKYPKKSFEINLFYELLDALSHPRPNSKWEWDKVNGGEKDRHNHNYDELMNQISDLSSENVLIKELSVVSCS